MIEETIQALPERYRYVIILRHKEEKSYEEIAEIMNLPLGTVKAQVFRAHEIFVVGRSIHGRKFGGKEADLLSLIADPFQVGDGLDDRDDQP